MKRLLPFKIALALATLLALVFAMPASSAGLITGGGGWQWSNPSVQGNTLNSVSFIDGSTGWAAGIGGTVIKTIDGGNNWIAQVPSSSCGGVATSGCNLSGIHFINSNEGWVVGDYGTIWHTTTSGDSWTSQTSGLPASGCAGGGTCTSTFLKDVYFIDSNNGIAVGDGYAFSTNNGGTTWVKIDTISTGHYLASVHLTSATNAVIVGSVGSTYRVTLSGGVWTAVQKSSGVADALRSVYFVDANNGFATGDNKILRTTNGGETWSYGTLAGGTALLWGVTVSGNNLIVAGGTAGAGNGAIYKRTSATNWSDNMDTVAAGLSAASIGTTSQILTVAMPTASTGFAAGEAGAITRTVNSGSTWSLKAGGNVKVISRASFIDDTTGWMAAMDGSVMKTVDGGVSWTNDSTGIAAGTSVQAVHFLDAGVGFAVGYSGGNGIAYKYKSGTWSAMTLPTGVSSLWGIHMTSPTTGWAVGVPGAGATTGVALRTTDGSNWTFVASGIGTDIQLTGVDSTDASTNGWAVGQKGSCASCTGVIYKYSAGSWTPIEKADTSFFTSIDMVDGNTGFAVGYYGGTPAAGRGYKTIDGGANWNPMTVGTSKLLSEVSFVDASNGYASGDEGRVIKTVNGGTNWTLESVGTSVGMNSVAAVSSSFAPSGIAAFIGGFNAAALRSVETNEVSSVSTTGVRVAQGDDISATFTRDLNPATVTNTSFTIKRQADSVPVTGTVTCDSPCRTATFNPDADLDYATNYVATLTTAIVGTDVVPLARNYTWTFSTARDYWWTWYDDQSAGALNWVLLANPDSGSQSNIYRLSIADTNKDLASYNNGVVAPGGNSLTPRYDGVIGGPVNAASIKDGTRGIVSQRVLWATNSLEEVVGTDSEDLSNRFFWPWYDDLTPGYTNWVLVANPGATDVWYEIRLAGNPVAGPGSSGSIAPGQSAYWREGSTRNGPVEVEAWSDSGHTGPANVMASQRILSNGDTAFNELPGTPDADRASRYLWTWYDNIGAAGNNLILIGNPSDGPTDLHYKILVGGQEKVTCSAAVPQNTMDFWSEAGLRDGPVDVTLYNDNTCSTLETKGVATQRIVWGPSLEEVPGYPETALASTYHWTWYDQVSAGSLNWVLIANPGGTSVNYEIKIGGVTMPTTAENPGTIPANGRVTPVFAGTRNGPVEVTSTGGNVMASQRVLWNGFFNETLGTVLN